MTILLWLQVLLFSVWLFDPAKEEVELGPELRGGSDGDRRLGVLIPLLSTPSPLQPDPCGAPCSHHPECQAGSLHGHES